MTNECQQCGWANQAEGACVRCGAITPPPPAATDPATAGPITPPPPAAPTPATTRRRPVLIAVVAVVAAALIGGAAFAATQVLPTLLNRDPSAPSGVMPSDAPAASAAAQPGQLRVTGAPPAATGRWASGTKEVWRTAGRHYDEYHKRWSTVFDLLATRAPQGWAIAEHIDEALYQSYGFDPATGNIIWKADSENCAETTVAGLVPCLVGVQRGSEEWESAIGLIDFATGKAVKTVTFNALGLPDNYVGHRDISVAGESIMVVLADFAEPESYAGVQDVLTVRLSADASKVIWRNSGPGCDYEQWSAPSWRTPPQESLHGAFDASMGRVLDFKSGAPVLPDGVCVRPVADTAWYAIAKDSTTVPATAQAPDGTTIHTIQSQPVFDTQGPLPPQPLRTENFRATTKNAYSETGPVDLVSFDPATGTPVWSTPVPGTKQGNVSSVGSVRWHGGRYLVASPDGVLRALDGGTGAVAWETTLNHDWHVDLQLLTDGTVLVADSQRSTAIDPVSGARLWSLPGYVGPAPLTDGTEALVQLIGGDGVPGSIARLEPANRTTESSVPSDAPACPSGMKAIDWIAYDTGAILLCQGEQTYRVVLTEHPDWEPTELTFLDGGYRVSFTNQATILTALGGSVVFTEHNGATTTKPATRAWSNARGDTKLTLPTDLPACPAGSWPISLSTFDGGWLLVCGTSTTQPTTLTLHRNGTSTESTSVAFDNGGYCGKTNTGTACSYRTPALVTLTGTDGTTTQHNAAATWFDGFGTSATGTGQGSYGVDAPKAEAADQVRYLTQILQKSSAARADLDKAVTNIRACEQVESATKILRGVTANREELLAALDSTPVDHIPDGPALVSKLRHALELSRDSDRVWVQWADAMRANCTTPADHPLHQQVQGMNVQVAAAKDTFLTDWNNRIAPTYQAPTFTRAQI